MSKELEQMGWARAQTTSSSTVPMDVRLYGRLKSQIIILKLEISILPTWPHFITNEMAEQITSHFDGFLLCSTIPSIYNGPVLPGSTSHLHSGNHGWVLIQEYISNEYSIRYHIAKLCQSLKLTFKNEAYRLQTRLALKNSFCHQVQHSKSTQLQQGQFCMLYGRDKLKETIKYKEDQECQTFNISFERELIKEMSALFPTLRKAVDQAHNEPVGYSFDTYQTSSQQMLDIIYTILYCQYEEPLRKHYIDGKIKEYLFLLLVKTSAVSIPTKITTVERAAVHAAKELILSNTNDHFTTKQIAAAVGLNEFKLKILFRRVTGMGTFECLIHARMLKARQLILETDKPMKEIAVITGYSTLAHFITAFRKRLGYTPGSLRRK